MASAIQKVAAMQSGQQQASPVSEEAYRALAEKRGWGPEQVARMKQYAQQVAQVESRGDPRVAQMGGGPGRGKYQFELAAGKGSGSNKVAIQRLKNFVAKHDVQASLSPEDLAVIQSEDPDFSQLSEPAQDLLFVANAAEHPRFKLDSLVNGELAPEDAWIKYHWAGGEKEEPTRRKHWKETNG